MGFVGTEHVIDNDTLFRWFVGTEHIAENEKKTGILTPSTKRNWLSGPPAVAAAMGFLLCVVLAGTVENLRKTLETP